MTNKIDLTDRTAVVTGGAQGIGRAIAERFLSRAPQVAIWDRDRALAERTAAELEITGQDGAVARRRHRLRAVEAATRTTAQRSAASTSSSTTPASPGPTPRPGSTDVEDWRKVMRVNLDGPFHCCRAVVPAHDRAELRAHRQHRLDRRQGGQSQRAPPTRPRRPASSRSPSRSARSSPATTSPVNCVTPAAAKTAIFDQMTQEHIDYMLSKIPRGRFVDGRGDRGARRLAAPRPRTPSPPAPCSTSPAAGRRTDARHRPRSPRDDNRVRKQRVTPFVQRPHEIRLGMDRLTFAITPFSSVGVERKMPNVVVAGLLPMLDRQRLAIVLAVEIGPHPLQSRPARAHVAPQRRPPGGSARASECPFVPGRRIDESPTVRGRVDRAHDRRGSYRHRKAEPVRRRNRQRAVLRRNHADRR